MKQITNIKNLVRLPKTKHSSEKLTMITPQFNIWLAGDYRLGALMLEL